MRRREATDEQTYGACMTMTGPARTILVANQKGGVGKSTTVAAVAEMIATAGKRGRRVLVVDGDPQANVTVEDLGVDGDRGQSLAATLQFGTPLTPVRDVRTHLDVIAGGPQLAVVGAAANTIAENGIDKVNELVGMGVPDVYSAGLSEFVFAAGVKIMERDRPEIMYLSTTDYIQHKHAPGTPVANDFYAMIDGYLAELDAMGATLVVTADHGMNAKHDGGGAPDVLYLQDLIDGWIGEGKARVILPITDPYVVHHGALGSYAVIHVEGEAQAEVAKRLRGQEGIEVVLSRAEACERFGLPPDRVGDLVAVATTHKVLGTSVSRHDLTQLKEPLRSHGGISEQEVPIIVSRPLTGQPDRRLRNFDAFDLALNYVA